MIPASNVSDLHLATEVIDAVREGRFNVWAVDSINDGIELLTGIEAGRWSEEGRVDTGERFQTVSGSSRRDGSPDAPIDQGPDQPR